MQEEVKKSFAPIVNNNSNLLILGSLPSDKSIAENEYYGNKTNQFWDIIRLVFGAKKIPFQDYHEKIQFLEKYHIALWDVYAAAQRKGSLDSDIKQGTYNDLKKFMKQYPNIKKILVNGKQAEKAFEQYLKKEDIDYAYQYVPSSSSANRRYTVLEKVDYWKEAIFR